MHDRVTICGGVLGGHPRLVADEILAQSVANCRSTWRWRDGSRAKIEPHRKAPVGRGRGEYLVNIDLGRGTAQKRVTGGRWRRIELGEHLAGRVGELGGSPRL